MEEEGGSWVGGLKGAVDVTRKRMDETPMSSEIARLIRAIICNTSLGRKQAQLFYQMTEALTIRAVEYDSAQDRYRHGLLNNFRIRECCDEHKLSTGRSWEEYGQETAASRFMSEVLTWSSLLPLQSLENMRSIDMRGSWSTGAMGYARSNAICLSFLLDSQPYWLFCLSNHRNGILKEGVETESTTCTAICKSVARRFLGASPE